MAEERLGWMRTALLAAGGAVGAAAGVLITAWLIHIARQGGT